VAAPELLVLELAEFAELFEFAALLLADLVELLELGVLELGVLELGVLELGVLELGVLELGVLELGDTVVPPFSVVRALDAPITFVNGMPPGVVVLPMP
jgi:hypothetical protein